MFVSKLIRLNSRFQITCLTMFTFDSVWIECLTTIAVLAFHPSRTI